MSTILRDFKHRSISTEAELRAWLATAEPRAVALHHDGFLAIDVGKSSQFATEEQAELIRIARLARRASEQHIVHLVQRRVAPNRFSYLAIKRALPALPAGCPRRSREVEPARLSMDVLVNGYGENRWIMRQPATRLRLSRIIERISP